MQPALTLLLLAVFFLVRRRRPLLAGPVFAVLILLAARWAGSSWTAIGVSPRGAGWAGAALGVTVAGYAIALAVPSLRRLFRDPRYRAGWGRAVYTALVAVPLATVAVEEVAFRGALWPIAVATPLLFGLWHVLPGTRTNAAAPSRLATFAVTFGAGVLLALVRQCSGGLLAPFVLHWAVNGLGVLASVAAERLNQAGPPWRPSG